VKKVEKNPSENPKSKNLIRRLIKFLIYIILLCFFIYLITWALSYWVIESHKMDTGEMISDVLKNVPED
jgi:hypothetical protein